ncbi:hypothetical protein TNCV_711031 [Trichonephila clavipes]|nr:hypothetical protein TNCV_711031 [Trichonephila clavipes]
MRYTRCTPTRIGPGAMSSSQVLLETRREEKLKQVKSVETEFVPLAWYGILGEKMATQATSTQDCGRFILVVKVTDLRQACHEFKPVPLNTPYREGHCRLNLSRLKHPSVGVVRKLGEGDASSGVVFVT